MSQATLSQTIPSIPSIPPPGMRDWIYRGFLPDADFQSFRTSIMLATHNEYRAALEFMPTGVRRLQVEAQLSGDAK